MKKHRFLSTLFALATSILFSCNAVALEVGENAPEFELPGASKTTVKLPKQPGKIIYLDFWASWCGPCRQSFPWMNALQDKYKPQDFQIIAVNLDTQPEDAEKFLAKLPAKFTIAFDSKGSTPKAFGVKGMPTSFVIGKDGKILYQHVGFNENNKEGLEKAIQAAVEGKK